MCPSLSVAQDSSGSGTWQGSGLTRDLAESRVVLSCIQSLATSTPNSRTSKNSTPSQKSSQSTRFDEFVEVSSCNSTTVSSQK